MTFFNTKDGPIVLDVPPRDKNGSFNGNIVTVWQMPLEDAGLLGVDKGKGGKFLILPPGYKGTSPKGYIPLQSDTFGGYALIRANLPSHGDADVARSIAYGKKVKVYPLAERVFQRRRRAVGDPRPCHAPPDDRPVAALDDRRQVAPAGAAAEQIRRVADA